MQLPYLKLTKNSIYRTQIFAQAMHNQRGSNKKHKTPPPGSLFRLIFREKQATKKEKRGPQPHPKSLQRYAEFGIL